jgi:hypothetical protein
MCLLFFDCVEIDLTETQKQLDKTALDLVESQKENLVGRKKLAEQTRGKYEFVVVGKAQASFVDFIFDLPLAFFSRIQEAPR